MTATQLPELQIVRHVRTGRMVYCIGGVLYLHGCNGTVFGMVANCVGDEFE
jgi:hypothetical protein